jgi:subtilase family serine protease
MVAPGAVLAAVWLPGLAQTAAPRPVRTEFLTAPRPLVTQNIDRGRMVRTEGAVSRAMATAQDLGVRDPTAPMEHIQLVQKRTQERQAAFDAQVEALHQHGSPNYHQWLTPETVGTEFGPSASDLATLTGYLQAEGFTVNEVGKSGMFVDFTGTVAQVQQSFHTQIHNVRLPNGEEHYSAVADAELPEALTPLVVGFVSLSDVSPVHPNYHLPVPPSARAVPANAVGPLPLDDVSSTNYAVAPQDFYTIYNENSLLTAPTPINGKGMTIALLERALSRRRT